MDETRLAEIKAKLAFLDAYGNDIRAIVLVGSVAAGTNEAGSDIDVVVVSADTDVASENISHMCWHLPDELERNNYQLSPFDAKNLRSLFAMGAPFALAVRNGIILKDDGFVTGLVADDSFPRMPTADYYFYAFTSVVHHYMRLVTIAVEIKHAPDENERSSGDYVAIVIFRLLYAVLPSRGIIPATKREAIQGAIEVYGEKWRPALDTALDIMRRDIWSITDDQFSVMKPFAVELWREMLRLVKDNKTAMSVLRQNASSTREIAEQIRQDKRGRL